jgi:hypothetical protein
MLLASVRTGLPDSVLRVQRLQFQGVELAKEALNALANLLSLGAERVDFLPQLGNGFGLRLELANLLFQRRNLLLRCCAGLALTVNEADSAQDAFFEVSEIICGQRSSVNRLRDRLRLELRIMAGKLS